MATATDETRNVLWRPNPGPQTDACAAAEFETFYGGAKGGGKLQTLDSQVLAPFGFRAMAKIEVGSQVTNPDGSVARVLAVWPHDPLPIYRVRFSDGTSLDVGDAHLWLAHRPGTVYKAERLSPFPFKGRITTTGALREVVADAQRKQQAGRDPHWPHIPVTRPVPFTVTHPRNCRSVHAYVIGCILGDGSVRESGSVVLTNPELALIERLRRFTEVTDHQEMKSWGLPGLSADMRRLGMAGKRSWEKSIPREYLHAPVAQRWELLRGLIDTDGTVDDRGHIEYSTVSRELADDVAFLARSLGGVCTIHGGVPGRYTDTNGEKQEGRVAWRTYMRFLDATKAVTLDRYHERCKRTQFGKLYKRIVDIEYQGEKPAQCITVDHPNGLYLADDFIVTHNSDVVVMRPLAQIDKPRHKALILREEYGQLEELLRRARDVYMKLPTSQRPAWNAQWKRFDFPNPRNRTGAGGASVYFGHCKNAKDTEKYQGREWSEVNFDELANVREEKVWTELTKEIRCKDPEVARRALGTGNPGYAGHPWIKRRFIKRCGKHGERVYVWRQTVPGLGELTRSRRYIPARVTDNPTYANDLDYMATLWSLPEMRRKQLLLGDWDVGVGLCLPELEEEVHKVRPFTVPKHWTIIGGFDWGYAHRWVFVLGAVTEDGWVIVLDTVRGRGDLPDEIARTIRHKVRDEYLERVLYVSAGHDTWHEKRARGENVPSVAERLVDAGLPLIKANQDRIHGLNNLRDYHAYRGRGPGRTDIDPALLFVESEGDDWLFEQCEGMVTDPDDPEKPLKIDVDPETGEGGDDGFDALRYMVASRPPRADSIALEQQLKAWDEEVLAHESRKGRKVRHVPRDNNEPYVPASIRQVVE